MDVAGLIALLSSPPAPAGVPASAPGDAHAFITALAQLGGEQVQSDTSDPTNSEAADQTAPAYETSNAAGASPLPQPDVSFTFPTHLAEHLPQASEKKKDPAPLDLAPSLTELPTTAPSDAKAPIAAASDLPPLPAENAARAHRGATIKHTPASVALPARATNHLDAHPADDQGSAPSEAGKTTRPIAPHRADPATDGKPAPVAVTPDAPPPNSNHSWSAARPHGKGEGPFVPAPAPALAPALAAPGPHAPVDLAAAPPPFQPLPPVKTRGQGAIDTAQGPNLPGTTFPVAVTGAPRHGSATLPDSGDSQLSFFTASLSRDDRAGHEVEPLARPHSDDPGAARPTRKTLGASATLDAALTAPTTTAAPEGATSTPAPEMADMLAPPLAQTSDPATSAGPALRHTAALPHPAHQIGQQLANAISDMSEGRPIELTLSPEELGRVRMTLTSTDSGLTLAVLAERPETLDLLRRHIDQLAQDFRDLGHHKLSFAFSRGDQQGHGRQEPPPGAALSDIPATVPLPHAAQPIHLVPLVAIQGNERLDIRL